MPFVRMEIKARRGLMTAPGSHPAGRAGLKRKSTPVPILQYNPWVPERQHCGGKAAGWHTFARDRMISPSSFLEGETDGFETNQPQRALKGRGRSGRRVGRARPDTGIGPNITVRHTRTRYVGY